MIRWDHYIAWHSGSVAGHSPTASEAEAVDTDAFALTALDTVSKQVEGCVRRRWCTADAGRIGLEVDVAGELPVAGA